LLIVVAIIVVISRKRSSNKIKAEDGLGDIDDVPMNTINRDSRQPSTAGYQRKFFFCMCVWFQRFKHFSHLSLAVPDAVKNVGDDDDEHYGQLELIDKNKAISPPNNCTKKKSECAIFWILSHRWVVFIDSKSPINKNGATNYESMPGADEHTGTDCKNLCFFAFARFFNFLKICRRTILNNS
jgi:hypothetical protein